jgi:hypothetical protein
MVIGVLPFVVAQLTGPGAHDIIIGNNGVASVIRAEESAGEFRSGFRRPLWRVQ